MTAQTTPYHYIRRYTGPIEAVIMDWAGTTVDFGSVAPIRAFQQLFANEGVPISETEARGPMGTEKREHIRQLCAHPRIRAEWTRVKGSEPDSADIDRMYADFVPLQIASIAKTAQLIPGMLDALAWMRAQNIRVGSNTGYATSMVEGLLARAAEQGYTPDANVCATEVPKGRPYPHMSLKNALALDVQHLCACVKIDDTLTGIEEGLNAGMWTIGVAVSGNEVGLSLEEWNALSAEQQQSRRSVAYQRMHGCGAHYVIDSIADVIPCLEAINARLARGEKP